MALEFSVWPPGAVEQLRAMARSLSAVSGQMGDTEVAQLKLLAATTVLTGFSDEEIAACVAEASAGLVGRDPHSAPEATALADAGGACRDARPVSLAPAQTIADRYRLLVFHGGPPNLQFWQALDTSRDRQVALTFVEPDRITPPERVQQILSHTRKLSRVNTPGFARVLDVAQVGARGLVVSEWIRGGSLAEVAATSPSPIGAARAIVSLAAAAGAAHQVGAILSLDHPSRIRVSIEGHVTLAFPATLPETTPADDVRGISAALYALLVDRWPLPAAGVLSGLQPAGLDGVGRPIDPRVVDRGIPAPISAASIRALHGSEAIPTAAGLLNLLRDAIRACSTRPPEPGADS